MGKIWRLGESGCHKCGRHGRTQRYNHVTDGVLRIPRLLVTQRDLVLCQFRRLPYRLWRLVLPFHHVPVDRCQDPSNTISIRLYQRRLHRSRPTCTWLHCCIVGRMNDHNKNTHTNLRCSNYWVKYTLICALAILLPLWLVCNLVLPLHFIGCYDVTFNLATILPTPFITPFQHIAFPYSKDISQVCTFYHLAYLSSIRLSLSSAGVGVVVIWSWFWCSKTLVYITVRLSLHRLMARDRFLVCLLLAPKSVTVASCCCLFAVKNFFVMSVLMSVVGNVLISGWCPSISLHCWSQGLWSWS